MTEHIVSSATSAVTGELARMLFSGLMGRIDRQAAAADKKLRRLDMLLIKIHSAVEAYEKHAHAIENAWLAKWRDKLKEAAAEGDEVLAGFRQRAMDGASQAAGDAHQQQQEQCSSAASAPATTTTTSASSSTPPSMVLGIRGAAMTTLSPSNEDMDRLNSAVEKLEELSPEIGDFLKLLKVEILALKAKSTEKTETVMATKGKRTRSRRSGSVQIAYQAMIEPPSQACARGPTARRGKMKASASSMVINMEAPEKKPTETTAVLNQTASQEDQAWVPLFDRLEKAYATICGAVELADGRDLRDHEWLAYWASILREAKGQGSAVLGAIGARRSATAVYGAGACCGEVPECCDGDREDSELGRFVCAMESLAGEGDYFAGLACLCPSY